MTATQLRRFVIVCLTILGVSVTCAAMAQEVAPPKAATVTIDAGKDYTSPETQALLDRRQALRMQMREINKQLRSLGR